MAMLDGVAISPEQNPPRVSIDLRKDDAKTMRKFRPGQVVKITLVGKITELSFRKPDDPEQVGYEGYASLDMTKMAVRLSERNQMEELLDDDE